MKESLLTDVFLHAGFFLALSALIIPLLRYLKIPTALGYLLAGVVLGPYGLSAVLDHSAFLDFISLEEAKHVKILAELGIVLLLFVVGLELTPRRLWQMRSMVFGLGGAQVIVTAFVIGGIAYFWGNNAQVSLMLGLGLALSSTAIVVQWLHEQKLFVTHTGRTSFSILLFQDLAVIPILLLLTILSADAGEGLAKYTILSVLKMVFTTLVIFFGGRFVLKPLFVFANRYGGPEVFTALSLLVVVASASVAAYSGLSMALGAFIAGLLLADTEYRHEISALIIPFKSMLLGIFFLSFGMGINLNYLAENPFWLFSSVFGLLCIKALIIFILCRMWQQSTAVSVESALLLAQAGEFGLLVVGNALSLNLIDQSVGQFMLLNVGFTMMLAPLIAPVARKAGIYLQKKKFLEKSQVGTGEEERVQHIVIFGFGRVGKSVAHNLCQEGFEVLGFDKSVERVHQARKELNPVFFGDATKKSTLEAAGIEKAACVVITLNDSISTKTIAQAVRRISRDTPLVVRAQSQADVMFFENLENTSVLAEDVVLSNDLSDIVLRRIGIMSDKKKETNQTGDLRLKETG